MNTIQLKRTTSAHPDFCMLVTQLDHDLRIRNGEMMDIYDQHNRIEAIDTVVIAYVNNTPAACGCFKPFDDHAVEIKRMFVQPQFRGKGLSKQVLQALENWARESGFTYTVLETGKKQVEALSLYPKAGYLEIPLYEPYVNLPDSVCFRKKL
ncbi:GNAT family N-acetyltransferase [Mucilaginibacter terrae]|uniref:GNAT family N-acetyltransferase n=1 Tax=Mucilaginibacter terrae TaxID=1955052 RepID=UPI00363F4717